MKPHAAALIAVIPFALGGPAPMEARSISTALCGGGAITIDLPMPDRNMPEDCPIKACHSVCSREKFDRDQGPVPG